MIFIIVINLILCYAETSGVPRGADPSSIHLYSTAEGFRCLDGSLIISLERINDDYCDCSDGSDEPGTAACPNGLFYCLNEGFRPLVLPSSRVGDGVCDCCDGSDEYTGLIQCNNNCMVLGEEMRIANEKTMQLVEEGFKIYLEYVEEGSTAKIEMKAKLLELESEKELLEAEKVKLDEIKKEAEVPEEEAKNRHKLLWEESKLKIKMDKKGESALKAFSEIDLNSDGRITINEMQARMEIDIDANGEVSYEEAKEYLEDGDAIEFPIFLEKVWDNIEQIFKTTIPTLVQENLEETTISTVKEDESYNGENEDEDNIDENSIKTNSDIEDEPMPPYDEETQKMISVANEARSNYEDVESKLQNVLSQIDDAKKILESDFGQKNEFYHLRGKCYEWSDREYVYKLCPFEKTTQRNKNGGSETNLGHWSRWSENDKYFVMLYEGGQSCWNGPDRSTKVVLECGLVNELVSASEPNRCEYKFHFSSPAVCGKGSEQSYTTPRQEL